MLDFIINALLFLIVLVILIIGAVQAHSIWLGEAKVDIDLDNRSKFRVISFGENDVILESEFMIANTGKRPDAMVLDAFSRHQLPEEQYDKAIVRTNLERSNFRRSDGYLEAFPFEGMKSEELIYTLSIRSKKSIIEVINEIPNLKLEVYVSYVGKEDYKIKRWYFIVSKEELKQAIKEAGVVA